MPISEIEEDAAANQDPVSVGDERGKPTHIELILTRPVTPFNTVVEIKLNRIIPMTIVGRINREFARWYVSRVRAPGHHSKYIWLIF